MTIFISPALINGAELTPDIKLSGTALSGLNDNNYNTNKTFKKNDAITITSKDGSKIAGIYILWNKPVSPWTLTTDNGSISCGNNGYLHEYIPLSSPSQSLTINIPSNNMAICDIRIFSAGPLPQDVQVWTPPCDKADIMIVSSHADDEILFFGGILPTYGVVRNATIQVVYMTEFWSTTPIREHEKLDGLWASGIKTYPTCLDFYDQYSSSLAQAMSQYDINIMTERLVDQIRRFKPQVIVTHDFNGEYGHGFHMITAKAVVDAVEAAANASKYPDSYKQYGQWDTKKTYIHLYGENKIRLDFRQPIPQMNNQTALDIAKAAYKKHVSQQWCWFYVSDDYQYSCAEYGLYRSTVGADTSNDLLCNLKTYAQIQAEEEEQKSIQASIEASSKEAESISASIKASEEAVIQASKEEASKHALQVAKEKEKQARTVKTLVISGSVLIIAAIGLLLYTNLKRKRR